MSSYDARSPKPAEHNSHVELQELGPGKQTLVEQIRVPVQRKADAVGDAALRDSAWVSMIQLVRGSETAEGKGTVHRAAAQGVATPSGLLPHGDTIQRAFGHHDISSIRAHTGPAAAASASVMGADAYATGDHVVLGRSTDLHTVAHEAAHVVQQRGGVQLKGGVGAAGDAYEQHADAVADAVIAGESAAPLLDQMAGIGHGGVAVQRVPKATSGATGGADAEIAPPTGGINKTGFIDNSKGANIHTGPAETGAPTVRDQPLPPATRVFVSGTHPSAVEWWYVTAYLDGTMVRGYVQHFRVNTDLPEPTAKLHQVVGGDTPEKLAVHEYGSSVRDGHDLRYYENVLLYVNQQRHHTAGIKGTYQDPGLAGGGSNNIELIANHRIWLVSPAYAKALEGVVPAGSLTGGVAAKVKRFLGHIEDLIASVTESRNHIGEVRDEYAEAIREHLPAIVGIVAGFITAEAISAFAAATPTGVGQAVAVVIQLALSAFGAAGAIQAGVEAMKHGAEWLTLAWTAKGNGKQIATASIEFIKMLVAIAMAAISALGAKANYRNALKIANKIPTGGLPAFAVEGGGEVGGAGARAGVLIGPGTGSIGAAGNAMMQADKDGSGGGNPEDSAPAKEAAEKKAAEAAEKTAAEAAAKEHVHEGGIEGDPQSPYYGKWDGGGIHDWDALEAICKRDGYRIKKVTEDPTTGARRVEVERIGIDPKTKAPITGTVKKTIYPRDLTPAQIDQAGDLALKSAVAKEPGAKLDPYGSKLKADGAPADGFFEATVNVGAPPRNVKIQGWFKELANGTKVITSNAPANNKTWPALAPKDY
ncbi:MAG: DUF4157 domain-containing protein [Kofleriaceae bacterium]